jgi:hypothetical protein
MLRTAQSCDRRLGGPVQSVWHAYRRKDGATLCGLDLSLVIVWDHPYVGALGTDRCEPCRVASKERAESH